MKRFLSPLICASSLLVLTACTMAPSYERPASPVAPLTTDQIAEVAATELSWRDFYQNTQLQSLIEDALENNRDLRVATYNLEQVRAQYRISRAQLLPSIGVTGSGVRQRIPGELSTTGESVVTEQYSAGVGIAAYELDFFGRVQSLKDIALEQYLATREARKAAQLSLVAEVADGYFTWVANTQLHNISTEMLQARQGSYDMVKRRADAGLASDLELSQAATGLHSSEIDVAFYERQVSESFTALERLVGTNLDQNALVATWQADASLREFPLVLNSEALLARPDIMQAEYMLRAANANIGAARAAFFPQISLTGSYGSTSRDLDNLFEGASRSWSFTPQVTVPIFTWGANKANLDVAKLQKDTNIARYEQAIQSAFKEVRDGLNAQLTFNSQLTAQEKLVNATSRSFELASLRYEKGVDSYLDVLDSQRSYNSAQQALITTQLNKLRNQLTLYKALGGGVDVAVNP